ncbi:hypothetical protein MRX96_012292 [Rhipicephalus microplus]
MVAAAAPRLEAAIVRCSSSTECCQEFPAADPDRSGWNPTLQVPDSASVFDLKIPPPDLRPEIRPSRSSSEDIEALNPIVLDTTEPYQTTIMLSHADTRLPRNVSFEKAQIPSYAEATAIENLPRTSPPAVSSQHTMFAHDSSPEATGSTTSGSSAVDDAPPASMEVGAKHACGRRQFHVTAREPSTSAATDVEAVPSGTFEELKDMSCSMRRTDLTAEGSTSLLYRTAEAAERTAAAQEVILAPRAQDGAGS